MDPKPSEDAFDPKPKLVGSRIQCKQSKREKMLEIKTFIVIKTNYCCCFVIIMLQYIIQRFFAKSGEMISFHRKKRKLAQISVHSPHVCGFIVHFKYTDVNIKTSTIIWARIKTQLGN